MSQAARVLPSVYKRHFFKNHRGGPIDPPPIHFRVKQSTCKILEKNKLFSENCTTIELVIQILLTLSKMQKLATLSEMSGINTIS